MSTPQTERAPARTSLLEVVRGWFDPASRPPGADAEPTRIEWVRSLPFLAMHAACLLVFAVGVSPAALYVAGVLYLVRMFAITGFYHRYFSHRSFKTTRAFQFLMAVIGCLAVQRGPLWWAGHHRHHHRHADRPGDLHSPVRNGFLWSHVGWITSRGSFATRSRSVRDLARYPELRLLDRFFYVPALLLALALWALGERLGPAAGTSGPQMLVWGFFVSTVVLYHATYTINSLAHRFGRRRYATGDDSRNNLWLSLLTLGEGWHNNHHHYPASTRQGFYWWEVDVTYYLLRTLSWTGLVWDLKPVPARVRNARRLPGDPRKGPPA